MASDWSTGGGHELNMVQVLAIRVDYFVYMHT